MSVHQRHPRHYELYLQRRGRLLAMARAQLAICEELKMDDRHVGQNPPGDVLRGAIDRLESDRHRALFTGRFSAGKSTLLNAMLAQDLLPRSVEPTTGVLTRLSFAEHAQRKATLHPKEGVGDPFELNIDDLKAEIKRYTKVNHMGDDLTGQYAELRIELPFEICRNGVEIIDSVGLDDPRARETVTFAEAPKADAIVYCMKTGDAYSASDIRALELMRAYGFTAILFVITNYDLVRTAAQRGETPESEFRRRMSDNLCQWSELGEAGIVYVDSWAALDGRINDKPHLVQESGILEVEAALESFLASIKGTTKLKTALQAIKQISQASRAQLAFDLRACQSSLETLEKACLDARLPLDALDMRRKLLVSSAEAAMSTIAHQAGDAAEKFFRALAGRVGDWAQSYEISGSLLPPTKEKVGAVVSEVSDYLTGRVQQAIGEWNKSTLQPLVEAELTKARELLEPEARNFLDKVEELKVEIATGNWRSEGTASEHELSAWDVIVGIGVTISTGDFLAGGMGALLGIKAMLRSLALQIAGVVLLSVLSMLNPVTLGISLLAGALGGGAMNLFELKTKVKKDVAKAVADELLAHTDESRKMVQASVETALKAVRDALDSGLASRVSSIRTGLEGELMRKRSERDDSKVRAERLISLQADVSAIETAIDSLLTECSAATQRT